MSYAIIKETKAFPMCAIFWALTSLFLLRFSSCSTCFFSRKTFASLSDLETLGLSVNSLSFRQ